MRYKGLKEMIGHFVKLLDLLDMSSDNSLVILVKSDSSKHLNIHELSKGK